MKLRYSKASFSMVWHSRKLFLRSPGNNTQRKLQGRPGRKEGSQKISIRWGRPASWQVRVEVVPELGAAGYE